MNDPEQIVAVAGLNRQLNETLSEPVSDLVEIEPEMLAEVAGGPDGSVLGIS